MVVRLVFLLLLVANLGFYAWMRFMAPPDEAVDPAPEHRQLEPHRLRIVGERELAAATSARAPAAKAAPARPEPERPAPADPASPSALACLEWGGFSPAEAARAAQRLEPLALGARLAQVRGEETASWWVHMPPQGDRAGAQRKAAELRQLGIQDYFIVQDPGRWRWAVSLGVFSTEEAASAHLEALRTRGVRTAVIGQRDTRVTKVWFQVRPVDAPLRSRLEAIARDFEGPTLHECVQRD